MENGEDLFLSKGLYISVADVLIFRILNIDHTNSNYCESHSISVRTNENATMAGRSEWSSAHARQLGKPV